MRLLLPPQLWIQLVYVTSHENDTRKEKKEAIKGLGKSQGSLLKRTYETFLYMESILNTGLYGIF